MGRIIEFPQAGSRKDGRPITEECVLCGVDTRVPKEQPIDLRTFWVDGAGQLCPRCYRDTYGSE